MAGERAYVFGYGSLLGAAPGAQLTRLEGFRRTWDVAMDNTVDLPGYKFYRRPDGSRPALFVTFLDLEAAAGAAVDGVLLAAGDLAALDRRERNYRRVDVTDRVRDAPPGRVWAYVGTPGARARFERGLREGRAAVPRSYRDGVLGAFAARGALDAFLASTLAPRCPVEALERVDLP